MHAKIVLKDAEATEEFGRKVASFCGADTVLFLYGDLGTGKTTFVRGFLNALGCPEKIKSPTYTLVEHYEVSDQTIYHFDLYRLDNPQELTFIGIDEYFSNGTIVLIEWPEKAGNYIPKPDLSLFLKMVEDGRELILKSHNKKGAKLLEKLI